MWVKQLIGRLAGTVTDLPYSAAENALANGTAVAATDAEILAAGLDPTGTVESLPATSLPAGYRTEPTEVGGFDLFDAAGLRLNREPFPNLAATVSFASEHVTATVLPVTKPPGTETPPAVSLADFYFQPDGSGGFLLFGPGGARLGDDVAPDEEAARLALREHYAVARGITLAELDTEEAKGNEREDKISIPDDWRTLHHTQRRALAHKISGVTPANTVAADEVIEEYLRAGPDV